MNYDFDYLLTNTTKSILVYKDDDDNYQLYGEYTISKHDNNFLVHRYNDHVATFHNVKPAAAWCAMHKRCKFYEANRLKELDVQIIGLTVDMQNQERFLKNKNDIDIWSIHSIKMSDVLVRRTAAIAEMNRYIDMANQWQLRKFKQSSKNA